ncbi:MAG: type II toxin-antitoxin system Phd/YefM family antitoxin [bacterium]
MKSQLLKQDKRPLSEVGANIKSFVEQVSKTKKPLILTHNGRSKAVLLDIDKYESLIEELELLKDIRIAEEQLHDGEYISNQEARKRLLGEE